MMALSHLHGCTGRWGFCGTLRVKHFSDFEFFLLPSRVHARPSASNANRWDYAHIKESELGNTVLRHAQPSLSPRRRTREGMIAGEERQQKPYKEIQ